MTFWIMLLIDVAILVGIVLAWRLRQPILTFWNDAYASWTRISQFGKHSILASVLIIVVVVVGLGCGWFARRNSTLWLCQYDIETDPDCASLVATPAMAMVGTTANVVPNSSSPAPSPTPVPSPTNALTPASNNTNAAPPSSTDSVNSGTSPSSTATPSPIPLTQEQKDRLATQSSKVKGLIRHHGRVMSFFFEAYYTAICVMLFAGAFVAIAMFFIATKGWSQTNPYVRTVFVVMTAAAASYGLWPPVFQQEKNVSDNKALFLEYETLQNEIYSYPVTRSTVKNEAKAPNDFINYVDSEMARIGNVAIGFDYTKITYKGAFESGNTSTPTPLPTVIPKKTP